MLDDRLILFIPSLHLANHPILSFPIKLTLVILLLSPHTAVQSTFHILIYIIVIKKPIVHQLHHQLYLPQHLAILLRQQPRLKRRHRVVVKRRPIERKLPPQRIPQLPNRPHPIHIRMMEKESRVIRRREDVEHVHPYLQVSRCMRTRRRVAHARHARLELADVRRVEQVGDGGGIGVAPGDGDVKVAPQAVHVELCPIGRENLVKQGGDEDGA